MKWEVSDAPASLPVTWPLLKSQCRLDTDDDRDFVLVLAAEAVAHAENKLEMSLMEREITATFYDGDALHLPRGPVIEVDSVTDDNGNTIEHTVKRIGNRDMLVIDASYDRPLVVVYTAGHASADAIDADILGAIRVHTATKYMWREDLSETAVRAVWKLDEFYRARGRGCPIA